MPLHPRYVDEPEYGREPPARAAVRRDREGREIRDVRDREPATREAPRERRTMEVEAPPRMAPRMIDTDMMGRESQQRVANAGVPRQDPRAVRNLPPRDREDDMMYDARPTAYPPTRDQQGARRTPYEGEFDDMPASIRPVIDPGRARNEPRPNYNEYFLPGDGIDREVIQSEICRYLGQDATCKPGSHDDGRKGYIIRAYRALTTEMIRSLKEDSSKFLRERENAVRRKQQPVSFSTFRDQSRYGGDEMMVDEPPEERYQPRYDEPRLRAPPVTSSYLPDAGYTSAYYPVTQPPPPGVDTRTMDPRYIPGNTTPPSSRTPSSYAPGGYPPAATRPPVPSVPAAGTYTDPRGNVVRDAGYGAYQPDPRARHR